jgi:hypothetical protein
MVRHLEKSLSNTEMGAESGCGQIDFFLHATQTLSLLDFGGWVNLITYGQATDRSIVGCSETHRIFP